MPDPQDGAIITLKLTFFLLLRIFYVILRMLGHGQPLRIGQRPHPQGQSARVSTQVHTRKGEHQCRTRFLQLRKSRST